MQTVGGIRGLLNQSSWQLFVFNWFSTMRAVHPVANRHQIRFESEKNLRFENNRLGFRLLFF